jgi:DNA-binding CsgD family transcriptional regulator
LSKVSSEQINLFKAASNKAAAICQVLNELKIHMFSFLERFSNGEVVYFSSNQNWLIDYFEKELSNSSEFDCDRPSQEGLDYVIWPKESSLDVYQYGRAVYDSDHGITLIKNLPHSIRYFFFSARQNFPEIKSLYGKHMHMLKRFAVFFEQELSSEIQIAHSLIVKPRHHKTSHIMPVNIQDFYQKTALKPQLGLLSDLGPDYSAIKLTAQEWRCLSLMVQHLTVTEMAAKLIISTRTVETHLNNLKNKFGCCRKTELFEIAFRIKHLF